MLWIIPAWIITCIGAALLGYHYRGLSKRIEHLEEAVKMKIDKPPEAQEPTSELIDPTDEVQNALYEHKKLMDRLNPK